jgi:hypothetical protein
MSQPTAPAPDSPDSPPPTPDTTDPDRVAAEARLKGLLKETILEVIAETDSAPPKSKTGKVDILSMLFGPQAKDK